jgi:hypothetical protein
MSIFFTEPERGNPSLVLAALKQTFAHRLLRELRAKARAPTNALWSTPVAVGHIWQCRFYDFVVFTEKKRMEKLRYMHRNPVQRGLVLKPEEWAWSSFRHYAYGERDEMRGNAGTGKCGDGEMRGQTGLAPLFSPDVRTF